jgi:hypothetical protein
MDPVVFDYRINERGTMADLLEDQEALMPAGYYSLTAPALLRGGGNDLPAVRRAEFDKVREAARRRPEFGVHPGPAIDDSPADEPERGPSLRDLLRENGFDRDQHERIRKALKAGTIGLSQNRLSADSVIEDVNDSDVGFVGARHRDLGERALRGGEVAVVTLAAGAGSRWTGGAGTCKALHPFARLGGRHRTFIETHLAKSRRVGRACGTVIPHVFTTGYLTNKPTGEWLEKVDGYGYGDKLVLSPGRSVGLRMVPTERDLRFAWEVMPRQVLDVQQQKVRDSLHAALIDWARSAGEASDYTDNVALQCMHPVGHFYELPSMLRNGTLKRLLAERPQLRHLLLHNIDTLGADADPDLLGMHIAGGDCLSFEVIHRRLEDRGGGLARVNGRVRGCWRAWRCRAKRTSSS